MKKQNKELKDFTEEMYGKKGFLPNKYVIPEKPGQYMRFEEGQNVFRVLSGAITGYEYWTEEEGKRKPNRVKKEDDLPDEIAKATGREKAKHFWAFVVQNVNAECIQILEITQKSIMKSILALVNDENWGDPKEYNIMVGRTKSGPRDMDVEYSVMPQPKKKMDEGIVAYYKALGIDLEALFRGENPFGETNE